PARAPLRPLRLLAGRPVARASAAARAAAPSSSSASITPSSTTAPSTASATCFPFSCGSSCRPSDAPSLAPLFVPIQHVLQRACLPGDRDVIVATMLVKDDVPTMGGAMGGLACGQHRQPNTRRFDRSTFRPVQISSGIRRPSFILGVRLRTVRFHLSATPFC
ncbi:hypothetical protein CF319_g9302, partial [Tilletia indica]